MCEEAALPLAVGAIVAQLGAISAWVHPVLEDLQARYAIAVRTDCENPNLRSTMPHLNHAVSIV